MKKILLSCMALIILLSSCSTSEGKMVISKFSNDTLYTASVNGHSVVTFDVPFEKTLSPTVKVIMSKAMVDENLANKWIRDGKSENITVVSKPSKDFSTQLALVMAIVIVIFLFGSMLRIAPKRG